MNPDLEQNKVSDDTPKSTYWTPIMQIDQIKHISNKHMGFWITIYSPPSPQNSIFSNYNESIDNILRTLVLYFVSYTIDSHIYLPSLVRASCKFITFKINLHLLNRYRCCFEFPKRLNLRINIYIYPDVNIIQLCLARKIHASIYTLIN